MENTMKCKICKSEKFEIVNGKFTSYKKIKHKMGCEDYDKY